MSNKERRLYISSIQHEEHATDIYWDPSADSFVFCEPEEDDWIMKRTELNIHAIAHILSFNPKKYGCATCGCSTEFLNGECVCWCDSCKKGCSNIVELKPLPSQPQTSAYPRTQFFRNIKLFLPPPNSNLKRLMTFASSDVESNTNPMIMENDDDESSSYEHFENLEYRMKRFRMSDD